MMERLLIIGDCHCSTSTIVDVKNSFRQITKLIKKHDLRYICFAGDIFDQHGSMKSEAYNFFIRYLKKWLDLFESLNIILDVGNHDFINNSIYCTDQHFLNPFKEWNRVKVIDFPQEYFIGENRVAIFPYIPEGRYFEAHEEFLEGSFDFRLFISHQTFRGGRMDNGQPSLISETWAPNYPLQISGHLHTPHEVKGNLIYIGSLIHCKHSEEGLKRVILVNFEEEEIKLESIELKPLDLYETITFDITADDIETIKRGRKIRYVLTGGSMGELVTFSIQYKNIFSNKVKFKPLKEESVINFTEDETDPIVELKESINDPLLDEIAPEQEAETRFKLRAPRKDLILHVESFIHLQDKIINLEKGLIAVRGDNGAGKTTLLRSIEWLLYGGNSPNGKKASVKLTNGKYWTIHRSSKPQKLILTVKSETYFDKTAQSIINQTFGTEKIWTTINYLQQKKHCNFFSSADKEKKEFFSQIFLKSGDLRKFAEILEEREKLTKKELEQAEIFYKNFIETVGEEEEELAPLNLDDVAELQPPNLDVFADLPAPNIEPLIEPPAVYYDDLREPEEPETESLQPLSFPTLPAAPKAPVLYCDDLKAPREPNLDDVADLPLPSYEMTAQPDLKPWEDLPIVEKGSLEKETKKLKKLKEALQNALKNNEEYEANEKRKIKRKELLKRQKPIEEAQKMSFLQKKLEEMKDIESRFHDEEKLEQFQKISENEKLKEKYRKLYTQEPSRERLETINHELKFYDAIASNCPACQEELLILPTRNDSIEVILSKGQKINKKPDDSERKLLNQIDFDLSSEYIEPQRARQEVIKYQLERDFKPGNYELFLNEQAEIKAELNLLKIKDLESIDTEEIEADIEAKRKLIEELRTIEKIKEENKERKRQRELILQTWKKENKEREDALIETTKKENEKRLKERNQRLEKWKMEKEAIEKEEKRRKEVWQKELTDLMDKWLNEKMQLITAWKKENERRAEELARRLKKWKETIEHIKSERIKREEEWQRAKERIQKNWEAERDKKLTQWKKENQKRKEEREKSIADWRSLNQARAKERESRTADYEKRKKRLEKENNKRRQLSTNIKEKAQLLSKYKDFVQKCHQLETKYFDQQLEVFNNIFDGILARIFENASGSISPTKENKNGSIAERITLEFVIDGQKRININSLSMGQSDLVSLAFQIALISIFPTPFKIILLDEPFSQISKSRLPGLTELMEEYLNDYYCLVVIHDHEVLNYNQILL